jgi:hypothetical protein
MASASFRFFLILLAACAVLTPSQNTYSQEKPKVDPPVDATDAVRDALKQLAAGKGDPARLTITYQNLRPFISLVLTIHGTGKVEQKAHPNTKAGEPKDVTPKDVSQLIALLVKHEAWQQKTPERDRGIGPSQISLTIQYGDKKSRIWEWNDELPKNGRIVVILEAMKNAAWKAPPEK